ncbi:MAG: hypothetical protein GXP33_03770 [Spirochaetes bacterium]|nr:hypothetical protein [Spirochaetota bacterium]
MSNWIAARKIFKKDIRVKYGSGISETGKEYYGYYNSNENPDTIVLNKDMLGGGVEGAAKLASIMSHESTHYFDHKANRDTYEANAYFNQAAAYNDLSKAWGVHDRGFIKATISKLLNPEKWKKSEGSIDYAEVFKNKDKIGIRSSNFGDKLMKAPIIGAPLRGVASILGINILTDRKQSQSELDNRRYDRETQIQSDQISAILFLGTAALTAEQGVIQGGLSFKNYIGSLINANPINIKTMADAFGTASNDIDIAKSLFQYFEKGNIEITSADRFDSFKEKIFKAERFTDIKGYKIEQDKEILKLMRQTGIPYEVANNFKGNKNLENKAVNELVNNFNFVSALYQKGTDDNTIKELYYQGVAYPLTDETGLTLWENSPGFGQENGWLTKNIFDNREYIRYQSKIEDMKTFYSMRKMYQTGADIDLSTNYMKNMNNTYKFMMDNRENYEYEEYFWNQYNKYESDLFR